MENGRRKTTVQSLQRGLEILVAVGEAHQPLGITELSRRFGLAKGSISRIVATLHQQAFLVRDPVTTKYRIGMKVWELGNGALARLDVRELARPVMVALNAATQETVHLTMLTEGDQMVFLEKLDSNRAVRPHVELGAPHPAYCTANGKAMLAWLPKAIVDRLLRGKLHRYTAATLTRKDKLLEQLAAVRRKGYAINRGEYRADVAGIAAPIRDHAGNAAAALGISLPANRLTPDLIAELAPGLTASAREISLALGYRDLVDSPTVNAEFPRAARGVGAPAPAMTGRQARANGRIDRP